LPLPLGRRLPSDRKVFESQKITGIRKSTIADAAIIPPGDSSAEDSTSHSAWTGTVSLRGEQTLLLRGVRNLRVPDETEFNATLRFTMSYRTGDVWYYEVFMDVENRPNEGRRLPRFRYREISRRAVVVNLRKLDHYGVVTMFRMRLLLDLKKGPLQWKR